MGLLNLISFFKGVCLIRAKEGFHSVLSYDHVQGHYDAMSAFSMPSRALDYYRRDRAVISRASDASIRRNPAWQRPSSVVPADNFASRARSPSVSDICWGITWKPPLLSTIRWNLDLVHSLIQRLHNALGAPSSRQRTATALLIRQRGTLQPTSLVSTQEGDATYSIQPLEPSCSQRACKAASVLLQRSANPAKLPSSATN